MPPPVQAAADLCHAGADRFAVAPMLDVTTAPFRRLCRLLTRRAMLYTEMIPAAALCHGRLAMLTHHPVEHPLTLQLGGGEPAELARAAALAADCGFAAINLNAGCPSDRVQQGCFGAVLMKDLPHLVRCYEAMAEACALPVTVKTRIGVDELDSPSFTQSLVAALKAAGCRLIVLHARRCLLHGLSPRDNRRVPPLDYARVHQVKAAFPEMQVILNGGLADLQQCREELALVDGVMLGRAVCDHPYMLAGVDEEIFGEKVHRPTRHEVVARALDLAEELCSAGERLAHLGRHLLNLFDGQPGSRAYRRYLSAHMNDPSAGPEVIAQAAQLVAPG